MPVYIIDDRRKSVRPPGPLAIVLAFFGLGALIGTLLACLAETFK